MAYQNPCANCESRDRPTNYEGGKTCRTCSLFVDLQVATHFIRLRQPTMLSVLDSALSDTRTLAHRILEMDSQTKSPHERQQENQKEDREARNWTFLGQNRIQDPDSREVLDSHNVPKAIVD